MTDPYESSASVRVDESCEVWARSDENGVPLIWSRNFGEGRFVIVNLGFMEKAYREAFTHPPTAF